MWCPAPPTRWFAAVGACVALAGSTPAEAQGVDAQKAIAAQALYDQAASEMDAGSHAAACPKLEEVTRLVPEGIGARLTLGDCYEKLGKLASAWSQFALAETMAARAGQPERARKAASRAAALRPGLATLTIDVPEPIRSIGGLVVVRDGVAVGGVQWGTALPVDTGAHEVLVTAPGHRSWKKSVEIVADGASVTVRVGGLEPELAASSREPPPRPAVRRDWPWQRPVGVAAIAAAGVGLAAGATLGLLAIAKKDQSNTDGHCRPSNRCDAAGLLLRDEAVALGDASTGAFIVAGAVLMGGIVLFATASPPPAASIRDNPPRAPVARVAFLPWGMRVEGRW